MGMAVAKGVGKGSIGINQLGKYIPPGTTLPAAPAAPTAPTSPLVNQLGGSASGKNKYLPDANGFVYASQAVNSSGAKTPVPMPQRKQ
jgi:hypothetical protein